MKESAMWSTLLALALSAPLFESIPLFPPQALHVHASSVVETPQGDLLAVWFQGTGERWADDVQLMGARRPQGAPAWSAPFPMADTPDLPDCNPVLFLDREARLSLVWVTIQDNLWGSALLKHRTATEYAGPGAPVWAWQEVIHARPVNLEAPFLAVADDAEATLGAILALNEGLKKEIEAARVAATNKLPSRLGWMTRVPPTRLQDGRLMLGLYSDVFNCSLAAFTADGGATWSFSEPILDPEARKLGAVQPSFVQRANGDIVAFMRDNGLPNYVRTATSRDGGQTWSRMGQLEIRDSGSSVQGLRLASGRWLLVNNDLANGRHRLTAHLSDDEGATWKWARALVETEAEGGSFSYPCVIQTADGSIVCTYSSHQDQPGKTIVQTRFNEDWILERPLPAPLGGNYGE
jgi:predicted neuraminidase